MITGDITSSNAIVLLGVASLYPQAQQLQGFGADEAFNADDVEPAEIVMGVDATVSGGFVPVLFPWNCTLMPGQGSDEIFENWYTSQLANKQLLKAFGSVTILATGREYTMTGGFLSRYKPMPEARKVLQARQFRITWSSILPAVWPDALSMARKEKAFKVTDSNSRDAGRAYWLKEMDAIDGEAWATRAVFGLARSGVDVPRDALESGGWGALLAVGFVKLVNLRYEDAKPLLEEMLGCAQFYDEKTGNKRSLILRGNAPDFEEIDTIMRLRWGGSSNST